MLHQSSGILRCQTIPDYGHKAFVEVDPDISKYYRSLIPKWISTNPQMYPAHITVVRNEQANELFGQHDGELVEFCYEPIVREGAVYFWLNCFSVRLEEIRLELGLPVSSPYTLPPEGFAKCFHCTIGNKKNL